MAHGLGRARQLVTPFLARGAAPYAILQKKTFAYTHVVFFLSGARLKSFAENKKSPRFFNQEDDISPCYHFSSSLSRGRDLCECLPAPSRYKGRSLRSLTVSPSLQLGALLRSHLQPFFLHSSQQPEFLCRSPKSLLSSSLLFSYFIP